MGRASMPMVPLTTLIEHNVVVHCQHSGGVGNFVVCLRAPFGGSILLSATPAGIAWRYGTKRPSATLVLTAIYKP